MAGVPQLPTGKCAECGQTNLLFRGLCEPCTRLDESRRVEEGHRMAGRVAFCTADTPPEANAVVWAKARAWDFRHNVYLYGPVGTGKTHMAKCLLTKAQDAGLTRWNVSARRMVKTAALFQEGSAWMETCRADVLLLDDVDKPRWTEDGLAALWELLDVRVAAKRKTIVTANMAPDKLRAYLRQRAPDNHSLVDAALDRMKPVIVLALTGASLRRMEGE